METEKLCALAVTLALAKCGDRSGAEKAVRAALPGAVEFGGFYYNDETRAAASPQTQPGRPARAG